MNVTEPKKIPQSLKLRIGDIVIADNTAYMVGRERAGDGPYVLRCLVTSCYANGTFETMEELSRRVEKGGWRVYPAKEYELQLVKREVF